MASEPRIANLEALLLPALENIVNQAADLQQTAKSLGRLRLDVKVKQLDKASVLKWSSEYESTPCEHKAAEALLATYTEALHVIDRLIIISEALNSASSPTTALEILHDVLTNIVGVEQIFFYSLFEENSFRLIGYTGNVRPAETLSSSRLLEEMLRTNCRAIGVGSDPATHAASRLMYLPLIEGGRVKSIVVCSGLSPHLRYLTSGTRIALTLIEKSFRVVVKKCTDSDCTNRADRHRGR